jgi:sporulation protein YlmC with PRC-barrel domain
MTETVQFTIGAVASCSDGVCGDVSRVVIDPVARAVTHLVVEPKHRHGLGRLVPLRLVDVVAGEIRLRCTLAEFGKLDPAEETQFVPGGSGYAGYGPGQVLNWPYYGLGGMNLGGMNMGGGGLGGTAMGGGSIPQTIIYDTLPLGEVAVRRGEHVHATDGLIGRVQGLVIDPRSHHVTHVLLQEGHLWGRKEVAIPIGSVASVDDGVRLSLAKQDVQDLPPVDVDHGDG